MYAQRGYLRRELNDLQGATEDFSAALLGQGLTPDQVRNVEASLAEARAAKTENELGRAQSDLTHGEFSRAADGAQLILVSHPNSVTAMCIQVEALVRGGRKREALADADRFVQQVPHDSLLHAQRGFLRRELNDPPGAAEDFAAALAGGGLTPDQQRNVEASLTEARAAGPQGAPPLAAPVAEVAKDQHIEIIAEKGQQTAKADPVAGARTTSAPAAADPAEGSAKIQTLRSLPKKARR